MPSSTGVMNFPDASMTSVSAESAIDARGPNQPRQSPFSVEWLYLYSYNSHVKKASISEAKNTLSALIDRVRGGASVLIVDRGRPVARLEPVGGAQSDDERLDQLVRDGLVRPGRGKTPRAIVATPPPAAKKGASALRALLDERREGR